MRVLSAVAAAKGYTYRANQDFVIIKRGGQDARADGMALILPDESSRFRNGISDAVGHHDFQKKCDGLGAVGAGCYLCTADATPTADSIRSPTNATAAP